MTNKLSKIEIPQKILNYLWDTDHTTLSKEKHSKYIIERVLELGAKEDVKWLEEVYDLETIKNVLKNSKRISTKTGTYYAMVYDIPKEELECIKKPYTQKQNRF